MVEVKVVKVFNDKDVNQFTTLGEVLKKPKERADMLIAGGYVVEVKSGKVSEPVKESKLEPIKEPAPENKAKTITTENIVKAKPSTKEEKKFD